MEDKRSKTEEEWKKELTPEEYRVLREKGTESAFTGVYVDAKEEGVYRCRACGNKLFSSDAKFDSGSGWPSFDALMDNSAVELIEDTTLGMKRTEVRCAKCGSHLGHVFDDGPTPTGKRYCINSIALELDKDNKNE